MFEKISRTSSECESSSSMMSRASCGERVFQMEKRKGVPFLSMLATS